MPNLVALSQMLLPSVLWHCWLYVYGAGSPILLLCDLYIIMAVLVSSLTVRSACTGNWDSLWKAGHDEHIMHWAVWACVDGDSSRVRRVICPKRIGIGLGLGLWSGLGLGLASNFGICTTLFRTNNPSDKWPVTCVDSLFPVFVG